jgi:hypothetical protein
MFCDPVEVLRQRIHLIIKGAIRELRRFVEELVAPRSVLGQLDKAVANDSAILAQAFNLIAGGRDPFRSAA